MIRPLMINFTDDEGGAGKAALRLYKALRQKDISASMLVSRKRTSIEGVLGPQTLWDRCRSIAGPSMERLFFQHRLRSPQTIFSVNGLPDSLPRALRKVSMHNLIHLHWINGGFVCIETLSKFQEPVVWTLHDIWPFSGGCHYPGTCTRYMEQCGSCPILGSDSSDDLSAKVWRRKSKAWKDLNLVLVAPSRWIGEEARKSSLFRDKRIDIIPNGIDLDRFRPREKRNIRKYLNFHNQKELILIISSGDDSDDRKGMGILAEALEKLKGFGHETDSELVVVGTDRLNRPQCFGIKTFCAGKIKGEKAMAEYYAAADLFVAPSREDNLPNAVLESMACGTPCVAFNVGGLPDMIDHKENGYLAVPYDSDDLAKGIAWILEDDRRRETLSLCARKKAEREFGLEMYASRYIVLYKELIESI